MDICLNYQKFQSLEFKIDVQFTHDTNLFKIWIRHVSMHIFYFKYQLSVKYFVILVFLLGHWNHRTTPFIEHSHVFYFTFLEQILYHIKRGNFLIPERWWPYKRGNYCNKNRSDRYRWKRSIFGSFFFKLFIYDALSLWY